MNGKEINNKRIFMKPGKNNQEDRENFIKYWAEFINNNEDEEWSKQQNALINSQIRNAGEKVTIKDSY